MTVTTPQAPTTPARYPSWYVVHDAHEEPELLVARNTETRLYLDYEKARRYSDHLFGKEHGQVSWVTTHTVLIDENADLLAGE